MNKPSGSQFTRRSFLYGLGASLGSLALTDCLARDAAKNPLAPKKPMLPAKAKNCIFLFMEGGPAHMDTFDPKPKLTELHLTKFTRQSEKASSMSKIGGSRASARAKPTLCCIPPDS